MSYSNFLPSVGGFSPNMSLINPSDAQGLLGGALSPEMQQQMMPMGMMNRYGQEMMGQQQTAQQPQPNQGMSQGDMMKMAGMAMQGFNRGQQGIQAPTQQIIRDQNQFRFAGMQQNPQMLAQALRNRG